MNTASILLRLQTIDGDGSDQLNVHLDVVAGHAHLSAFGKSDNTGNVGGTEEQLYRMRLERSLVLPP